MMFVKESWFYEGGGIMSKRIGERGTGKAFWKPVESAGASPGNASALARASIDGNRLLLFNHLDLGEMMTLGSNSAAISALGGRSRRSSSRRFVYSARMLTQGQAFAAANLAGRSKINSKRDAQKKEEEEGGLR